MHIDAVGAVMADTNRIIEEYWAGAFHPRAIGTLLVENAFLDRGFPAVGIGEEYPTDASDLSTAMGPAFTASGRALERDRTKAADSLTFSPRVVIKSALLR